MKQSREIEHAQYREAAQLYEELGSMRAVAQALNISSSSAHRRVQGAKRLGMMIDPAMRGAMDAVGANYEPSVAWVKTKNPQGGTEYSVMLRRKPDIDETVDAAERLEELFANTPAVKLPMPRKTAARKRFAFIPVSDLHAGMYAWDDETRSGSWDTDTAVKRYRRWMQSLLTRLPKDLDEVIIVHNGDTLHANDNRNMTPRSGHVLDVDTRQYRTLDLTALAITEIAEQAAQMFPRVRLVFNPGNHDPEAYLALLFACKYRYRDQKNITVDEQPGAHWAYSRGKVLLFATHGHTVKPDHMVHGIAAQFPEEWGRTRYRYAWTAHHHSREGARIGGVQWERASCVTERDAYAAEGMWDNAPSLVAVVYDEDRGEVERHTVGVWAD